MIEQLNDQQRPVVSVVIPVFNGRPWLVHQVNSIQAQQTHYSFEIILADNGSTDGSLDDAKAIARSDSRVRSVDASVRRGNAACRNLAAGAANGDVLLFTDQDDLCGSTWLQQMASAVLEGTLASGSLAFFESDEAPSDDMQRPPSLSLYPFDFLPYGICTNLGVARPVFDELSGFDESFKTAWDVDFTWRAQEAGYRLQAVENAVVYKRRKRRGRETFWQHFAYGIDDSLLHERHKEFGMRRRWVFAGKQFVWLALNFPRALVLPRTAGRTWVNVLGMRVGRAYGRLIRLRVG